MKVLVSLLLLAAGLGGGGVFYVKSGGQIPRGAEKYLSFLQTGERAEDISERSDLYKLCHREYASRLSPKGDHPSRAACDCFETRISYVSPSVKKSVLERLKTDYESASGAIMGVGRIATTQAAWDFLASCQMVPGQQQPIESVPANSPAPGLENRAPVDDDALKSMLRDL